MVMLSLFRIKFEVLFGANSLTNCSLKGEPEGVPSSSKLNRTVFMIGNWQLDSSVGTTPFPSLHYTFMLPAATTTVPSILAHSPPPPHLFFFFPPFNPFSLISVSHALAFFLYNISAALASSHESCSSF
ncbi:unnamed protein product [Chondrus crispus]|uniref:Uncharacterized protein n=1 Tax=Chondrus crispus TaxID=2769 RepID=R7Q9T6_CHOCR|nr:unnamed protein product [Chondrus crispus]CDF34240.1 unnamed protein product [Chondrus crispus]|eukprot:XP_005714059.1 unnamed protein product [Chondrus crispus]